MNGSLEVAKSGKSVRIRGIRGLLFEVASGATIRVAKWSADEENRYVEMHEQRRQENPFVPGAIVLVTLNDPREKFWGAIVELAAAGLSIRGLELNCFEDSASMLHSGETFDPNLVFFPMQRVERIELDAAAPGIPSLSQRFASKTGLDAERFLSGARETRARQGGV
jgi:hypothetical protein